MKLDLEKVRVIDVKPGDVLVLRHPVILTNNARENIRKMMLDLFPDNRFVVLEAGMTIDAFRKVEDTHAQGT